MTNKMKSEAFHTAYGSFPPDWSVGVLYAGSQSCLPLHSWEGVRDHLVLHLVTGGSGRFYAGRRRLELGPHSLFVIRPLQHVFYQASEQTPWSYRWVGFDGMHALELVENIGLTEKRPVLTLSNATQVARLLEETARTLASHRPTSQMRAVGLLYQTLAAVYEGTTSGTSTRTTAAELVAEAQAFMNQNFQREIGVADVTRHIGIDRSHFSRVFRSHTGESMQEFLIRVRMERAHRLLRETGLPVKAVAGSVGYVSYHSFVRRFAGYFGKPPSKARESQEAASASDDPEIRERSDSRSRP